MITGFEDITYPLTDSELEMVPFIKEKLQEHIGKQNSITNSSIVLAIQLAKNIIWKQSRVRRVINHIRNNNLIKGLCATSSGYFIASIREEHEEYIDSLKQRVSAIQSILNKSLQDYNEIYGDS